MSVKELKIGKRFIQVEKSSVNVPTPSPQQQKTITQNKQNLHSDELLKLLLNKIDSIENKTIVKNEFLDNIKFSCMSAFIDFLM